MPAFRVAIVGTGSLARAVCGALAGDPTGPPLDVSVLGRTPDKGVEVAYLAGTRARLSGAEVRFHAGTVDLESAAGVAEVLGRIDPQLVLHVASYQSPWERSTAPSAWTQLLGAAGFGAALPLQAKLAIEVSRAVAAAAPDAAFVNACFPDAVNPVLAALDLPVLCGIGNIGLLAASLQAALDLPDQRRLRVLAHHVHLHEPEDPADEARAWLDGAPVEGVTDLLAAQRGTTRSELNVVTGHTAALLVRALATGAGTDTHLPGPFGLPGGYPVRVDGRKITLNLPDGMTRDTAVEENQRAALRDGVQVNGDRVVLAPAAARALGRHLPELAAGFSVTEIVDVCDRLLAVRRRLRVS